MSGKNRIGLTRPFRFQPQLSSREDKPYPLTMAFVQHVADFRRKRLDDSILT